MWCYLGPQVSFKYTQKRTYIFGKWFQKRRKRFWVVNALSWQGAATLYPVQKYPCSLPLASANVAESKTLHIISTREIMLAPREPLISKIKHQKMYFQSPLCNTSSGYVIISSWNQNCCSGNTTSEGTSGQHRVVYTLGV